MAARARTLTESRKTVVKMVGESFASSLRKFAGSASGAEPRGFGGVKIVLV
jgi:hypothetical protein